MISVVCVGECMLELRHEDERTLRLGFAGDTYNTAVYLRRVADRLGVALDVGYRTGLGEDHYSDAMRGAWRDEGIADRAVSVRDRVPGIYAIRTDRDGERDFTYWRRESAARAALAAPSFWQHLAGDLVHLSGITLQLVPPQTLPSLIAALRRVRAGGGRVSFDTNHRAEGWPSPDDARRAFGAACAEADIILASRGDEQSFHGEERPESAISRLAAHGASEVVLRAGAEGAYTLVGNSVRHVPAERVEQIVDTTAAGDASAGAYLAARLAGCDVIAATTLANSVAAVAIQHPGALLSRDIALPGSDLPERVHEPGGVAGTCGSRPA